MNPNLPPIGKYSNKVIDRDALATAFKVPAGFNDRQTNLWLASNRPGGLGDYQSPDDLDMDLLRSLMDGGKDASIEALNQSLGVMADVLNGKRADDDPEQQAFAESAALGTVGAAAAPGSSSPLVPAQARPAVIGLSLTTRLRSVAATQASLATLKPSALSDTFRADLAARLRSAGY